MADGAGDGGRARARGAVPAARVVAAAALAAAVAAVVTACSSSSGAAPRSGTPGTGPATTASSAPTSSSVTSAPDTSSAPAVALSPTATATVRKIADVPAARRVGGNGCTGPEVLLDSWLNTQLYQHDATDQKIVVHNTIPIAVHDLPKIASARGAWLAAGYPSAYPVVKDISAEYAAVKQLIPILRRADLPAITAPASRLYVAQKQYDIDVASAHRSGCAGI